jgi:hypothetical protein
LPKDENKGAGGNPDQAMPSLDEQEPGQSNNERYIIHLDTHSRWAKPHMHFIIFFTISCHPYTYKNYQQTPHLEPIWYHQTSPILQTSFLVGTFFGRFLQQDGSSIISKKTQQYLLCMYIR